VKPLPTAFDGDHLLIRGDRAPQPAGDDE
jgi:hypothetical protein